MEQKQLSIECNIPSEDISVVSPRQKGRIKIGTHFESAINRTLWWEGNVNAKVRHNSNWNYQLSFQYLFSLCYLTTLSRRLAELIATQLKDCFLYFYLDVAMWVSSSLTRVGTTFKNSHAKRSVSFSMNLLKWGPDVLEHFQPKGNIKWKLNAIMSK
jgi:hypothetical protein